MAEDVFSSRPPASDAAGHTSRVRVLIVEDEAPLASTLERGLRVEGFDCDVVHDGAEGFHQASSATYGAVVLDLLLPSMNGFTICRQLRDAANWTPVLILTAKDGDYDLVEALECGADDYLTKPFSFVILAARLRALMRRGHTPRPPALEAGRLVLDPYTRLCVDGERNIHLTPRETSVLAALLRRHPGVVSKDDMLTEVWGPEFEGDANIIDVYVGHLRRKLADPGTSVSITNVRGIGFRIESLT